MLDAHDEDLVFEAVDGEEDGERAVVEGASRAQVTPGAVRLFDVLELTEVVLGGALNEGA